MLVTHPGWEVFHRILCKSAENLEKQICNLPGNNPFVYYFESMKLKTALSLIKSLLNKEKFVLYLIEQSEKDEREAAPIK